MKILAMAPATDEEQKIGDVVRRIPREFVDEILVVDDGSQDATPDVARNEGAKVISHSARQGVGSCIREAIRYGRKNKFDILVVMAGNNKDDPAEIPRLTSPIFDEGFDFVQGSRYLSGGQYGGDMPLYRKLATRYVHPLLFSLISGQRITDSTNGFRAFRLSIFNDGRMDLDQSWLDKYELEPYIFHKAIKLGYRVKEAPVTKIYPPKQLGYTKMKPITGWWSILRPLIYLGLGIKK